MSKKKRIEAHGKLEDVKTQPSTLEQVWGYSGLSRFGVKSEAEYKEKVDDMQRADLERETRRLGQVVVESTTRLRENLLRLFRTEAAALNRPADKPQSRTAPDAAALKVLSEGR